MKRFLILLLVALAAVSCTTPRYVSRQPSMEVEWIGRTHADIVRAFGAPSREVSDGADGLILVYEEMFTTYETDRWGSTMTTTGLEHRNFSEFFLTADGICYDVRTNTLMQSGRRFDYFSTFGIILGSLLLILSLPAR